MKATKEEVAKAFEQWANDYRKDPDAFGKILDIAAKTYGERCAETLERYLKNKD